MPSFNTFRDLADKSLTVFNGRYIATGLSTGLGTSLGTGGLSLLLLACIGCGVSACSTISVETQATAKALVKERDNIITSNGLSVASESTLNTYGLEPNLCLSDFDACTQYLQDSLFEPTSQQSLAMFAELFYAKAQQLQQSDACQNYLARPPIDPYYANAPLNPEQNTLAVKQTKACIQSYRHNLHQAIRYSYGYLFYDKLTKPKGQPHNFANVVNEQDIQTLDIYNTASSNIIESLYQKKLSLYRNDSNNDAKLLTKQLLTNQAVINDTTTTLFHSNNKTDNPKTYQPKQIQVLHTTVNATQLNLYLPNQPEYLQNLPTPHSNQPPDADISIFENLLPTSSLLLNGLNSVSKRQGFGVSYVAQTSDRYTSSIRSLLSSQNNQGETDDPNSRIYPTGNLLLTGFILPKGNNLDAVLNSHTFDIHLYDPYKTKHVQILGQTYPMAGNFSASYGLWLNDNQLGSIGYFNLLNRTDTATLPRLFMLEPYDPNKRIIIMMHGLASSPATWVGLTNDIFNDEKLRESYQVWQIFYPTNIPMIENRHQIQTLIETAYRQTDPTGQNPASQHSVIIGHSMGALISRMMLSNDDLNQRLHQLDSLTDVTHTASNNKGHGSLADTRASNQRRQDNRLIKQAYNQPLVQDRLQLTALAPVDTAVFISAPFRGTDYADRWFTRAIRKVIHLPMAINQTIFGNLSSLITSHELKDNPLGALFLQNGASQLSDKSSFVALTKDLNIADNVTYHSIIASNDDDIISQLQADDIEDMEKIKDAKGTKQLAKSDTAPPADNMQKLSITKQLDGKNAITAQISDKLSDGIVPYASSHLDGAKSETILSGGHGIHENPQTILLLRRILHEHLQAHPLAKNADD